MSSVAHDHGRTTMQGRPRVRHRAVRWASAAALVPELGQGDRIAVNRVAAVRAVAELQPAHVARLDRLRERVRRVLRLRPVGRAGRERQGQDGGERRGARPAHDPVPEVRPVLRGRPAVVVRDAAHSLLPCSVPFGTGGTLPHPPDVPDARDEPARFVPGFFTSCPAAATAGQPQSGVTGLIAYQRRMLSSPPGPGS